MIVTSYLFDREGRFLKERLEALAAEVGREKVIVDLSCRRKADGWQVAMNRWQTLTELEVSHVVLDELASLCGEFLIHAADVEGKCGGVDLELVELLGQWEGRSVTYAGGAASMADLEKVQAHSNGRVDITVGSALDLFGGAGMTYREVVAWNHRETNAL